uniref:Uncharacterized protein n=1 Tax=Trichuris muris TaxID=70415 RepID=A0A5S6QQ11_TRIMR
MTCFGENFRASQEKLEGSFPALKSLWCGDLGATTDIPFHQLDTELNGKLRLDCLRYISSEYRRHGRKPSVISNSVR